MTRTRTLAALLALAVAAAATAPAADAAPGRLWYKVEASYSWKSDLDFVYKSGVRTDHTTTEFAWKVKTPTNGFTNEAPLVHRDRATGKVSFGEGLTAYAEGALTKSEFRGTHTLVEPPGQNYYNCAPQVTKNRQTLIGKPKISVLVSLSDEGFGASPNVPDSNPRASGTDLTGPITCERCLDPHPLRFTDPTYNGASCTYAPGGLYDAEAPYLTTYNHGRALEDRVRQGHSFRQRGRFGAKRLRVSSTSTAQYESSIGQVTTGGYDKTETVTEKIAITFKRCPGTGRRPC